MGHKVVAMETKLRAVFSAGLTASVTELCGELEISRQTFYKYKARWEAEGPGGLVERSRRPHHSPNQVAGELEDQIVRLRKELAELGVDHGAATIAYHLARQGRPTPALATIHRVLVRRGQVVPEPHKRPRSATRRFVWPRPNDAWQIDATRWMLTGGGEAWVMDLLDDHSRVVLAARACGGPTAEAAWAAFCDASSRWGLPAHVMSDNGLCFTGRLVNDGEADFERDLRALGIRHIPSSPAHPQTCGKLERFHQTLKRWLAAQPLAATHADLQAQLDAFVAYYNHVRPHQALAGATPAEVWASAGRATPGPPLSAPSRASLHSVNRGGHVGWRGLVVGVGSRFAGQQVLVVARGDDLAVFAGGGLVRRFTVDRSRRYQPTGRPPGRPPRRATGPCS